MGGVDRRPSGPKRIDLAEEEAGTAGARGPVGLQRPEELLLLGDRAEGLGAGLAADACNVQVLEVHEETGALVIDGGVGRPLDALLRPIPEDAPPPRRGNCKYCIPTEPPVGK